MLLHIDELPATKEAQMNQFLEADCLEQFVGGSARGMICVRKRVINPQTYAGTIELIEHVDGELRITMQGVGRHHQVTARSQCAWSDDSKSLVIDSPGSAPTTKRIVLTLP